MTAPRIHLVDGPPGCGKTTYLARQAERAAERHGASSVAIASLTRTAAAEIAGREHTIPEENVGTLHAHAYRALDRPDLADTAKSLREYSEAHPADAMTGGVTEPDDAIDAEQGSGTRADDVHRQVLIHRARCTPREHWTPEQIEHDNRWRDFKAQTGRSDFTDLIERCIGERGVAHPAHPRVLLLDEAQDFSVLEMRLAMAWARRTETTVIVGDPRQALYGWRGSDPDTLLNLDVTDRRILEQSYRVPRAVHELAQHVAGHLPIGPAAYHARDADGRVEHALGLHLQSDELVARLAEDHHAGRDVMVLCACGYMLGPLLAKLRATGLPFHNPHRVKQGAWNPMRGAGRLAAFLRPSSDVWGDAARAWTWDDLRLWTEPLQASTALARGAKALIARKCEADRFGEHDAGEVPLDVLMDNILGTADFNHPALRMDVDWWAEHLRANEAKSARYPLEVLRKTGPAALRATPRITVGTIHSTKGAEAQRVYLAPDLSVRGDAAWGMGDADRDAVVRMFYVGVTRAREGVVVMDPAGPTHVPAGLLGGEQPARQRARGGELEARIAARLAERAAA